jgi:hypothetical protein
MTPAFFLAGAFAPGGLSEPRGRHASRSGHLGSGDADVKCCRPATGAVIGCPRATQRPPDVEGPLSDVGRESSAPGRNSAPRRWRGRGDAPGPTSSAAEGWRCDAGMTFSMVDLGTAITPWRASKPRIWSPVTLRLWRRGSPGSPCSHPARGRRSEATPDAWAGPPLAPAGRDGWGVGINRSVRLAG